MKRVEVHMLEVSVRGISFMIINQILVHIDGPTRTGCLL